MAKSAFNRIFNPMSQKKAIDAGVSSGKARASAPKGKPMQISGTFPALSSGTKKTIAVPKVKKSSKK